MKKLALLVVVSAVLPFGSAKAGTEPSRQVIGDWVVTCAPTPAGHKSCMMTQTLASKTLGKAVSVFTIGRDRKGKLKGSIRMPVGVALPAGVVVGFENSDPFTVPFSACHQIGCFAPFDLTEPVLAKLRKATKISAVAESVSQKSLQLSFSGKGFPAAYETYLRESR